MNIEIFFKIAFFVILFSFAYVMTAYTKKAKARKESTAARVKLHDQHEVPLLLRLRQIFGIPFYLGVLVWTFAPRFMEWSALPLPIWVRWMGLGLGLSAVFLNAWSHRTLSQKLGEDFDPALRLLKVPALVKEGPYATLRHPIYLAFLLMQISVLFLTSNWFIGFCGIAIIVSVIAIRVPAEEKLLIEQFGDEYRNYMKTTGLLLPKTGLKI
ncbi:MAG TPA: isoprenylcysteine carboxylmethyltransferase family protein [Anaerolineales bacterium]|nr:isoprenylcysteine carboxylmethyltransferase family protein [Anaerolineales bacterium]